MRPIKEIMINEVIAMATNNSTRLNPLLDGGEEADGMGSVGGDFGENDGEGIALALFQRGAGRLLDLDRKP